MTNPVTNPIAVEVLRDGRVESFHHGSVAVCDAQGVVRLACGDIESPIFPRSALKPIQALALLETGAAKAFAVSDVELALACASHNGEAPHVDAVTRWLSRLDLSEDALACGAHWSLTESVTRAMARAGAQPSDVHNNCSGKHAGMLTTARHLGAETAGYESVGHPVQIKVRDAISEMSGVDLGDAGAATDGCSVPAYAIPLAGLARAFAQLSHIRDSQGVRGASCQRLVSAMASNPFMVAGTGRYCTNVIKAGNGKLLVKTGAEGVMAAALPDLGVGVAVKIDDGARRAAEAAMAAVLLAVGSLPEQTRTCLRSYAAATVHNWRDQVVGTIRAAPGFPS